VTYRSVSPFDWIATLPSAEKAAVEAALIPVPLRRDDIYSPITPARGIYRVLAGSASMYLLGPEGRRVLLKRFVPGECFGEVATLDRKPYPVFVSGDRRLDLAVLPMDRVEALRRELPAIDGAVVAAVCRFTRSLVSMLASATTDNAMERVRARLVWLAENQATVGPVTEIAVTQLELADMLGLSRQTVNEVLQAMTANGDIEQARSRIILRFNWRGYSHSISLGGDTISVPGHQPPPG
jgi:CRP-like cAMP-binding protein